MMIELPLWLISGSAVVPEGQPTVAALIEGNRVQLLDRFGRRIASVNRERLGPLEQGVAVRMRWERTAKRLAIRAKQHFCAPRNAWSARAASLAASFNLRRYERDPLGGRKRFEKYRTTEWKDASHRLRQQITNRCRVRTRSGWQRWSYTVSNNQAKRVAAYERRRQNHG